MEKRLLNTQHIAEYLDVSTSTIRSWVKHGKIPYMKLGKCVRFDLNELNKWLRGKRIQEFQRSHLESS